MIDRVVADIPNADSGFRLIFAATPFPGHQCQLDWIRADEDGGNWYRSTDLDMEGWLCPALNTAGVTARFTYTSTAGGAFPEWLEG